MNIYDFDHTIYPGDSTLDFWRFCICHHPAVLCALPQAILCGALFGMKLCRREQFKESFYRFLRYVPDVEEAVKAFWQRNLSRVYPWYLKQKREDDLIISASPEFLILPACRLLGVRGIASRVSLETGALLGTNCRGEEKVVRLCEEYLEEQVEEFYSDSNTDAPLAKLAGRAYLVRHGKRLPWPQ